MAAVNPTTMASDLEAAWDADGVLAIPGAAPDSARTSKSHLCAVIAAGVCAEINAEGGVGSGFTGVARDGTLLGDGASTPLGANTATIATRAYADAGDSAEAAARASGDASTLSAAQSYADAAVAAEAIARAAADASEASTRASADTAEASARVSGDASTLTSAQSYTDTALGGYLKKDGSVALTGDWSAGSHKITSLGTPTAGTDAANKSYVDSTASSVTVVTSAPVSGNGTSGSPVTIADGAIGDPKLATSYIKADGTRAFTADQSVGNHKLTNVTDPAAAQDAATKHYVDSNFLGASLSKSFALAGGAHDYSADSGWSSSVYTEDSGSIVATELLGDGSDAPYFWALSTGKLAATNGVQRTASGTIRLNWRTTVAGGGSAFGWPETSSTSNPTILIPLPPSLKVTAELVLSTNRGAVTISGNPTGGVCAGIGCWASASGGAPLILAAAALYDANAGGLKSQKTNLWTSTDQASTASVSSYYSSGVITRAFKFVWDGVNAAVYGGAVGATTASTLLRGRRWVNSGAGLVQPFLFVGLFSGGTPDVSFYGEISSLTVSGTRAYF